MKFNGRKGITLVALVVTIVVLIILASVTIAMLTGDNGIIGKVEEAKKETELARNKRRATIDVERITNRYK